MNPKLIDIIVTHSDNMLSSQHIQTTTINPESNQPNKKLTNDMNRHFTEMEIRIVNKSMSVSSIFWIVKKIKRPPWNTFLPIDL